MNKKISTFKALAAATILFPTIAGAEVFIKYDTLAGGTGVKSGYGGGEWFIADSFSFGVEREMKESGEKGGTADINIGIGELQPLNISKEPDSLTATLAQYSINGNSIGDVEVCVTDNPAEPTDCYLRYKLERCFVKSWSISGDADDRPTEEVAFYYNKIAFSYAHTKDGKEDATVSWDKVTHQPWPSGELALSGAY